MAAGGDTLRVICAALALLLVPLCVYSMYRCATLGQQLRFGALALLGVVVVAWQIEAWGHPLHWRVPILFVGLACALAGTVIHLRETRSELED
jgi:hypothetical protein